MAQLRNLEHHANAVRHSDTLERLTRIGFICKGVVYILIGALALLAALGEGGETTDPRGAISRVSGQPFGELMLVVIGIGLLAYAVWRFCCAFLDAEGEGADAKAIATRVGWFFGGLAYVGFGWYALNLALGNSGGGGDDTQRWTARLLDAPGGFVLVVLVGLAIIGAGVAQLHLGWSEKFKKRLRSLPGGHEWVIRAGKIGYIARGAVFLVMGLFGILAGIRHRASEARGLEGALDTLAAQPFGPWLLGLVGLGFAAYGVYALVESRYRKLQF